MKTIYFQNVRLPEWDIMRLDETIPSLPAPLPVPTTRLLPAPTPIHPTPVTPVTHVTPTFPPVTVTGVTEFYVDTFHGAALQYPAPVPPSPVVTPQYTSSHHHVSLQYPPAPTHHQEPYQQHTTYQQQSLSSHPTFAAYTPFSTSSTPDPKQRHAARSPVNGKFVRTGPLQPKRQEAAPKERKRPGPKTKVKQESEPKPPDEPEYDPEVIANAHLTMDDDYYVCSVCKMKFKQPGNARRHIITVHRNEKNHECLKCSARFGRKVRFNVVICVQLGAAIL